MSDGSHYHHRSTPSRIVKSFTNFCSMQRWWARAANLQQCNQWQTSFALCRVGLLITLEIRFFFSFYRTHYQHWLKKILINTAAGQLQYLFKWFGLVCTWLVMRPLLLLVCWWEIHFIWLQLRRHATSPLTNHTRPTNY